MNHRLSRFDWEASPPFVVNDTQAQTPEIEPFISPKWGDIAAGKAVPKTNTSNPYLLPVLLGPGYIPLRYSDGIGALPFSGGCLIAASGIMELR